MSFYIAGFFKKMKFNVLVVLVVFLILSAAEPAVASFVMILSYVLSGPFTTLWLRKKRQSEAAAAERLETPFKKPV